MPRNGIPHNPCRRFVKTVQFLRAVQARAVRVAGAPVNPTHQELPAAQHPDDWPSKNAFTGHGHAAEMPALIAKPFGNEQKMGILAAA